MKYSDFWWILNKWCGVMVIRVKVLRGFLGSSIEMRILEGIWWNFWCGFKSWEFGENKIVRVCVSVKDERDVYRENIRDL